MTFADLGLSDRLLSAVLAAGYTKPTPIQAKAIPVALEGRDVLGLAQTGTGKTASFTLPMIDILAQGRVRARMPRSLILAPTRELAVQVSENFEKYGKYNKLTMALLIGGVSFNEQDKKLDRGVDVLIATPGRLLDHTERGKVLLSGVQLLVIDEADRMLDMGFIPDIERIINLTPFTRQTLFFSATMPDEIEDLTRRFLQNPVRIEAARPSSTAETVTQAVCIVRTEDKREALRQLVRRNDVKNAIIFCNRKRDVTVVFRSLTKHGFNVAALHGDLDQRVRLQVLDQFRKGNIQLLVASDVAARGLDIPDVSHVFNFDVPFNSEDYVHRIGRTGRAGRSGHAFMIATQAESKYIAGIEKLIEKSIPTMTIDGLEGRDEEEGGEEGRGRSNTRRRRRSGSSADGASESSRNRPSRDGGGKDNAGRDGGTRDGPGREASGRDGSRRNGSPRERGRDRRDDRDTNNPAPGRPGQDRRNRRDRRRRDDDDEPVIGLGDHVPAFLLRPVRLPSSSAQSSSRSEAEQDDGASETKPDMDEAVAQSA
ncbi:MAG: DEAD/DEAH box helicase [Alphaproteobacteria bacterium]